MLTIDARNKIEKRIPGLSEFVGWKHDQVIFELLGLYVEWI
jgi:hypothetical protein